MFGAHHLFKNIIHISKYYILDYLMIHHVLIDQHVFGSKFEVV